MFALADGEVTLAHTFSVGLHQELPFFSFFPISPLHSCATAMAADFTSGLQCLDSIIV